MKKTKTPGKIPILLWALFSICVLSQHGFAQNNPNGARKITGRITATGTSEPIEGAGVKVKGTSNSVVTDKNGQFTIFAQTGETLVLSFVGYTSREIKLTEAMGNIGIALAEDFGKLDDVVVIGYGKMKKTDLSSAQVTVTAADIAKTVNTTFDQALQGRAANVYVSSFSGQPGAPPSVVIRGLSSITGSTQPLYVIDGVQIKPDNLEDNPNSHPTGFANALSGINPDDIETMNILQGPSATAIFGSVGANGVIMITTKRGKAGETKISASTSWTIQDMPKHIPVMNLQQYATYRNEMQKAGSTASDPSFADPSILGPGTDWQSALYRRTLLQKHTIALSGGSDKTTFYFSGEYFNQQGIAPGSGFTRGSIRLNLENQTTKWLKVGTNLSVNQTREKVNTTNAGIISLALQQNPSIPVMNPDGSWGGPTTSQFQFSNPVALAIINNDYNKSMGFIGSGYADIAIMKGLVLHNEINSTFQYNNNYTFHPSYQFGALINATSIATRTAANNYWWGLNSRLQYDTKIGKHAISVMAAHEAQSYGNENVFGQRQGYVSNDIQELSGGDQTTSISNSAKGDGARESYFGRVNYVYNDRYILQGTYRYDGSSVFGQNKRWGSFPAVSAAWRISQENFMKELTAVNDLKLRVEYGVSGNSNAQGYYAQLQSVPTAWGTGFLSQNFSNPDMQWEVDKTLNLGFDLHMFNNRVEVIADAYVKNIDKLLTVNPYAYYNGGDISYSAGYISWPTTNVGSMQNKGFGITVNTVNIQNKAFTWRTGFNFSIDRNKVTKLQTPINFSYNSSQAEFVTEVGQPASMITGYIAEGLFKNYNDIVTHAVQTSTNGVMTVSPQGTWAGDVKFKDLNGDHVIDQNDRTIIGNPWPKYTFGFNNSFSYNRFDLNVFIVGSVGNDILNYSRYQSETGAGVYGNFLQSVSNFARVSSYNIQDSSSVALLNPGYTIARIAPGDPNGNNRISQWYIESGSYVRVKNVSISFSFPAKWIAKTQLKGLRLSGNVQNLLTITGYKGYDPEIGLSHSNGVLVSGVYQGGTIMAGLDPGRYPNVRMYSFSLVADF